MVSDTAADMFLNILKHHIGINSVLLCSKHKRLVNITQEQRFNDTYMDIVLSVPKKYKRLNCYCEGAAYSKCLFLVLSHR